MDRRDLMLAALSAGGQSAGFEPVQVQKLFFLIDREIPGLINGPYFDFRPYDYGPFDSAVYSELDQMAKDGLVSIIYGYYRAYRLTEDGYQKGTIALSSLTDPARDFIERAARWVYALSFQQLVSAIYQKYPDMKTASVFRS